MKYRNLIIFALLVFIFPITVCKEEPKGEIIDKKGIKVNMINNVIQLNPDNFKDLVDLHDLSLIKFYAPSCGHCIKMAPSFAQLAKDFSKDSQVLIGEINTSTYEEFTDSFKIFHIPTLYLFHLGDKMMEYTGNKTARDMNAYLIKMKQLLLNPITSIAEIEEIKSTFETALIYFGNNEEDIKTFDNELVVFSMRNKCSDDNVMKHYNVQPRTMVLFKMFDEKRNDFVIKNKLDYLEGSQFALNNSKAKVKIMSYELYIEIFAYDKPAVILFYNGKDNQAKNEEYQQIYLEIARKALDEMDEVEPVTFTTVDIAKEGTEKSIAKEAKLTAKSKLPLIKIVDTKNGKNYAYSGAFKVEGILNFIKKWKRDELVPIQFDEL